MDTNENNVITEVTEATEDLKNYVVSSQYKKMNRRRLCYIKVINTGITLTEKILLII